MDLGRDSPVADALLEAAISREELVVLERELVRVARSGAADRLRLAEVLAAMKRRGLTSETWARVDGPAGLDIGARTPQEIAISIIASITAHREGISVTTQRPSEAKHVTVAPAQAQAAVGAPAPEEHHGAHGHTKGSCCHD